MIIATAQIPQGFHQGNIDLEQVVWEAPKANGPITLALLPSNVEPGSVDLVARCGDIHIGAHEMEAARPLWVQRVPEAFLPRPKADCLDCGGTGAVEVIRITGWSIEREETIEEQTASVCFCCLPAEPAQERVEWDGPIPF